MIITNFRKIKLTTENIKEKEQKEFIINNIDKIIKDILENDKNFIEYMNEDFSINYEIFDIKTLVLKYNKHKIYCYELIEKLTNNKLYFIYNAKNNSFFYKYSNIPSHSQFAKNDEYLRDNFRNYKKIDDFIKRYSIDNFSIINDDKNNTFLNNIHKSEILNK